MAATPPRFQRAYPPLLPASPDTPTLYLPFLGGELVMGAENLFLSALPHDFTVANDDLLYLGILDGQACCAFAVSEETPLPDGYRKVGLRSLYGNIGDQEYGLAGYASQLLGWQRISRFCGVCGSPTEKETGTWGRRCTACGHTFYPPVSPAVLALVHDGADRILLAQKSGWGKRYSILAGFVEPGESLEECAIREVAEEVGVDVTDVLYQGSQPWPFPHQVMVGFTARYTGGEIELEEAELSHAAWFRFDELPELPPPLSLSRQIIDRWIASRQ